MSLFSAKTWWSPPPNNDGYNEGCLVVANVDNESPQQDKLVTGSMKGILRIYSPHFGEYDAQDLIFEHDTTHPILQIAVGQFALPSLDLHIAVLHPKILSVYKVEAKGSEGHSIRVVYQHLLKHTAVNFTHGKFLLEKENDREMFCIQSMDGVLAFFDQAKVMFSRYLPSFLLPGPLCYSSALHAILTATSSGDVQAYRIAALMMAGEGPSTSGEDADASSKRVTPSWSTIMGEFVTDIQSLDTSPPTIFVLGEQTLFRLSEAGAVVGSRRLETEGSTMFLYPNGVDTMVLLGTHEGMLEVQKAERVVWCASLLPIIPLALARAKFKGTEGLVVAHDDVGRVGVVYMGTDPSLPPPVQAENRDLDYASMDAEMSSLQQTIKSLLLEENRDSLNTELIQIKCHNVEGEPEAGAVVLVEVVLSAFSPDTVLQDTAVRVQAHAPFAVDQETFILPFLGGPHGDRAAFQVRFVVAGNAPVTSLTANIFTSYIAPSGEGRSIVCEVVLPTTLVCRPAPPAKNAAYKLTFDTDKPALQMNDLFPEFGAVSSSNAFALQLCTGETVTIITSKSAGRYRIQGDSFEALAVVVQAFVTAVSTHFQGKVSITYGEPLPLDDLFSIIELHFTFRKKIQEMLLLIEEKSEQYRIIQKRLLSKFKDVTPSPLQHLDSILEGTFHQLIALIEAVSDNQAGLLLVSARLSAALHLIILLAKHHFNLDVAQARVLHSTLQPESLSPSTENGWEERVDAAISHLLRTSLSKTPNRETLLNPPPLSLPPDLSKLKKHFAELFVRLAKGTSLVE